MSSTAATSYNAFTADTFKRVQPAEYYRRILEQDIRPDGRTFTAFRPTILNAGCISTAEGSAVVRIGDTTVVCGIKAEVAEPELSTPTSGYIVPNIELGPLCSSQFRPGPPGDMAQRVSERLHKLAKQIVPLDKLCIEEGQAVWTLYADLVCLNFDGDVMDAAQLALTAALQNTRLPEATLGADGAVRAGRERTIPLELNSPILAATFGIYEGRALLADPNASEEPLLDSHITVCLDADQTLHAVWKNGGGRCSLDQLRQCIDMARERYRVLSQLLQQEVAVSSAADAMDTDDGGSTAALS